MSWTNPRTWVTGEKLTKALMDEQVRDNLNFLKINLALEAAVELTIVSGVITKTRGHHTVDTESDAATDDLDTINGGSEGDALFIRPASGSRTIVLKHNTGNIWSPVGKDVILESADDYAILFFSGAKWSLLGGSGQVKVSGTPTADMYALWVNNDTIEGKTKAQVMDDLEIMTEVLGFVMMSLPDSHGLFADAVAKELRMRTSLAVAGENILVTQGYKWSNGALYANR